MPKIPVIKPRRSITDAVDLALQYREKLEYNKKAWIAVGEFIEWLQGLPTAMTNEERLILVKTWVTKNRIDTKTRYPEDSDFLMCLARKAQKDGVYSKNTFQPDIARSLSRYFKKIRSEA